MTDTKSKATRSKKADTSADKPVKTSKTAATKTAVKKPAAKAATAARATKSTKTPATAPVKTAAAAKKPAAKPAPAKSAAVKAKPAATKSKPAAAKTKSAAGKTKPEPTKKAAPKAATATKPAAKKAATKAAPKAAPKAAAPKKAAGKATATKAAAKSAPSKTSPAASKTKAGGKSTAAATTAKKATKAPAAKPAASKAAAKKPAAAKSAAATPAAEPAPKERVEGASVNFSSVQEPPSHLTMRVDTNRVVAFHYRLCEVRPDGNRSQWLEASFGRQPLLYLHGHGNVVPGLEQAMAGKRAGDRIEITLTPEQAYGPRTSNEMLRIPIKHLHRAPERKNLVPGAIVSVKTNRGIKNALVIKVGKFNVDLDTNHPYAGRTLHYQIEVLGVRQASAEEVAHRHVHGPGGHQH